MALHVLMTVVYLQASTGLVISAGVGVGVGVGAGAGAGAGGFEFDTPYVRMYLHVKFGQ